MSNSATVTAVEVGRREDDGTEDEAVAASDYARALFNLLERPLLLLLLLFVMLEVFCTFVLNAFV